MSDWRKAVISVDSTIRDALRALNKAGLKIALICDELDTLIAVVSDGDIRRGLLADLHMDDAVLSVANRNPKTADYSWSRDRIKEAFIGGSLDVLPVVNGQNRVVALHTLASISERPILDNPVFIMAGGFGTRLRPLTDNCPKPMLLIGDKPILRHTIERMKSQGFRNFYISTHYLPNQIMDYFGNGDSLGVRINYVHENKPLGTGGALGLLPLDMAECPLVVLNGDVLTELDFVDLVEAHVKKSADATICLREQETSLAYGVVEVESDRVIGMVEKPTYRHLINTGIYVLSHSCFRSVEKEKHLDLPSLLERRINQGKRVAAYTFFGKWIDVGQMNDYVRAQSTFKTFGR